MKIRTGISLQILAAFLFLSNPADAVAEDGKWHSLFDGTNFDDWTVNTENPDSIFVEDGVIKVDGARAHVFYTGPVGNADFRNFELRVMVKTMPGANSGIYFHTEYQDEDWPQKGFEAQVNNDGRSPIVTGSLYGVAELWKPREDDPDFRLRFVRDAAQIAVNESPAQSGEWYEYTITVQDQTVEIRIDGETQVIWTQPESWPKPGRRIDSGTFALQAHDPNSEVHFKDIKVRILE